MIISFLSYIMSKNTWEMIRCKRLTGISLNTEPLWYSRTPATALSSWRLSGAPETDLPDANARWRSSFYFGVWANIRSLKATFEPSWQNKEHRHCLHVGRFYLQAGRCSYSAPSSSCSRRCWYSQPRRGTEHKIEEAFFFLFTYFGHSVLFVQPKLPLMSH